MKKGRKWCLQPLQMYLKVLQEQQTQVHNSIDWVRVIREFFYESWAEWVFGMPVSIDYTGLISLSRALPSARRANAVIPSEARDLSWFKCSRKERFLVVRPGGLLGMTAILILPASRDVLNRRLEACLYNMP